ncbi:thiamine pyrophosphate protein [Bordetella pertussis]|nr:thiamine pyrophosphate protein [Bordetella pertussis]
MRAAHDEYLATLAPLPSPGPLNLDSRPSWKTPPAPWSATPATAASR